MNTKGGGDRRPRSENGTSQTIEPSSSPRLSPNEWQYAFDHVISDADGRAQFTKFLQSEYSEENILFWWAVEQLKAVCASDSRPEFERTVLEMFETFIASESPLAINIDHETRTDIMDRVENKDPSSFPNNIYERAQAHVYRLMEKDCFSRFVHTPAYKEVAKKIGLPQTFRFNEKITPS
ncbi:Regulator of G-protein signaling [Parelaphostrongylus tenuis]|uniref:Regulator of G-protein signaling n=1 Tax=Parelaphostrongylus tenuis TaxID=148309 RepID=A0AAD5MRS0_PARTN|nr:Regulator of G-protein signaling [Parelaphostrongylus tenuis]